MAKALRQQAFTWPNADPDLLLGVTKPQCVVISHLIYWPLEKVTVSLKVYFKTYLKKC